jgi:hypothetical protein
MKDYLKMIFASILLVGGLIRGCSRAGKVADSATDLSKASRIGRIDDAAQLGVAARALDDVAYLDPNIVSARFSVFEINHANNLPKTSFITKAYKSSEGLSPNMRLKMLQMELMPPSVKSNLLRDNSGHLYSVMMGKKINAEEAAALQALFEVPVKATDQATDGFHYISSNFPKNLDQYDRHQEIRHARALQSKVNKSKKISSIDQQRISGNYGEKSMDEFSEIWAKNKTRQRQTIIVEEPIAPKQARVLSLHKIKAVYHARHLFDNHNEKSDMDVQAIFVVNESVESFAQFNQLSMVEAIEIRNKILKLKGKKGVTIIENISELEEHVRKKQITLESLNILIGSAVIEETPFLSIGNKTITLHTIRPTRGNVNDILSSQINLPSWDIFLGVFGSNKSITGIDKFHVTEKISSLVVEFIKKENPNIEDAVVNFDFEGIDGRFMVITYLYKEDLTVN